MRLFKRGQADKADKVSGPDRSEWRVQAFVPGSSSGSPEFAYEPMIVTGAARAKKEAAALKSSFGSTPVRVECAPWDGNTTDPATAARFGIRPQ